MHITLELPIDDFNREIYDFWLPDYGNKMFLNEYRWDKRETKRRNWKTMKKYHRLSGRECTMKEEEVLLTDAIKEMALEKLKSSLTVEKWSNK